MNNLAQLQMQQTNVCTKVLNHAAEGEHTQNRLYFINFSCRFYANQIYAQKKDTNRHENCVIVMQQKILLNHNYHVRCATINANLFCLVFSSFSQIKLVLPQPFYKLEFYE